MKIDSVKPFVETSDDFVEKSFSVGDAGMIFEILRSKMYSNAIWAVCREISANARDAHREVGKSDPIHIQLPTHLEPSLKIKDFGPGISPDRIENVYVKYANSTKRNDNIQQGGWGLGAKSVFSYSDSFSIVTIVDGTKYHYTCFIDETKVGKLALLDKTETTESNGTEIIVPVQKKDLSNFVQWMEVSTRHWEVKPVFNGIQVEYKKINKILEGTKWFVTESQSYYETPVFVIVDGVEYPVPQTAIPDLSKAKIAIFRGNLFLSFGIGELSLSASRESINVDEKTVSAIAKAIDYVSKEIQKSIQEQVAKAETLLDAYKARKNAIFIFKRQPENIVMNWKGFELGTNSVYQLFGNVSCKVFFREIRRGKTSLRQHESNGMPVDENVEVFFDDVGIPINDFNGNSIKPWENLSESNLTKKLIVLFPPDKDKFLADPQVQELGIQKVSSFYKAKKNRSSGQKLIVYKHGATKTKIGFLGSSMDDFEKCTKEKVLVKLSLENNEKYFLFGSIKKPEHIFERLEVMFPEVAFFGYMDTIPDDKVKEDLEGGVLFEEWAKSNLFESKELDSKVLEYLRRSNFPEDLKSLLVERGIKEMIESLPNQSFFKINLQPFINQEFINVNLIGNYMHFLQQINQIKYDELVAQWVQEKPIHVISKILKHYPLLKYLTAPSYWDRQQMNLPDFKNYILLIDQKANP